MKIFIGVCLACIVLFFGVFSLCKTLGVGTDIVNSFEVWAGGDKALHFFGAGIISAMLCYLFSYRFSANRISFWVMGVLLIEECSQAILPNRHFNFDDIGAGCSGVLIFVLTYKLFAS